MSEKSASLTYDEFSSAHLAYMLGIFFTINVFSYMDRIVLSVLVEPIKQELLLTDTQMGLLTGFAFALFYAVMGFPIARLADKGHRKHIIVISMALWSLMTALSGKAQSFLHLLLARIGVGIGEAGCLPAATALITEMFPEKKRAFAMGVFMAGSSVGVILGFVIGGFLAQMYGWRTAFIAIGLPGVAVAVIVMLTLKEKKPVDVAQSRQNTSYIKSVKALFTSRSYCLIVAGAALGTFATYGMLQWAPTFFIRSHGLSLAEVGTIFGIAYGGGTAIGMVAGGWITDRVTHLSIAWMPRVPAIAYIATLPMLLLTFYINETQTAIVCLFLSAVFTGFVTGPTFASLQFVAPADGRATAVALLMFFSSLCGVGAAPFVVGLLSDQLSAVFAQESLRYALLAVTGVVAIAGYCFFAAARHFSRMEQVQHGYS